MNAEGLDEIDEGIIYLLQQDARYLLAGDMAERLPVSEGTVRNRLRELEERGVLNGYHPRVNYRAAGYSLEIIYWCQAPIPEREDLARQALDVSGVIDVREMMTGIDNVRVHAVAKDTEEMTTIATELASLGLTVEVEELLRREHVCPFDRFDEAVVDDGENATNWSDSDE